MASPVIIPVIMCGGSGKRLWPLSRENFPKQFLRLNFEHSLLQQTVMRFSNEDIFHKPIIISNYQYRFHCAEQLSEIGVKQMAILLEHHSRNTAPALAAAAHYVQQKYGDNCLILALPSDHYFKNDSKIEQVVQAAAATAQDGNIVTFGIAPTHAETGYGYIQYDSWEKEPINRIIKFHEKPDSETAQKMLESGDYLWNSGIFLFSPETFISELKTYNPQISKLAKQSVDKAEIDLGFTSLAAEPYSKCENISVDYAVMENTKKAYVAKWDTEWKDIGSWLALCELFSKDANSNTLQGNVIAQSTNNSLIRSDKKLTAVIGVDDLIIINTNDALLVAAKSKLHEVKDLVETLKNKGHEEYNATRLEYRPWGYYEVIEDAEDYKVKKIHVRPGQKISLQKHMHRAEHWVILSGEAKITCNNKEIRLKRDQSTYIPNQSVHRIENMGLNDLIFIEVQTGGYLGEDDIIRIDDDFGRHHEAEPVEKKKAYA